MEQPRTKPRLWWVRESAPKTSRPFLRLWQWLLCVVTRHFLDDRFIGSQWALKGPATHHSDIEKARVSFTPTSGQWVSDLFLRVTPALLNFVYQHLSRRIKKIAPPQHHSHTRGCSLLSTEGNCVVRECVCIIYIGRRWVRGQGVEFSASGRAQLILIQPRLPHHQFIIRLHEFNYQLVKTTALASDEYENSGGRPSQSSQVAQMWFIYHYNNHHRAVNFHFCLKSRCAQREISSTKTDLRCWWKMFKQLVSNLHLPKTVSVIENLQQARGQNLIPCASQVSPAKNYSKDYVEILH